MSLLSNPDPDPKRLGPINYAHEKRILKEACRKGYLQVQFVEPPVRCDFVRNFLAQIEIFHFAGHGAIQVVAGGAPSAGLYFAKNPKGSEFVVAQVIAEEARRREAVVAVLNACHSATQVGEIAADLPAAFARSGVSTVIGYSAPVDDRTSAICLKRIAAYLEIGDSFEPALVEARLDLRSMFPGTCRWATLVMYARPSGPAFVRPSMDDSDGSAVRDGAAIDTAFSRFYRKWLLPLGLGVATAVCSLWIWQGAQDRELLRTGIVLLAAALLFGAFSWLVVGRLLSTRAALLGAIASEVNENRRAADEGNEHLGKIRAERTRAIRIAWESSEITDWNGRLTSLLRSGVSGTARYSRAFLEATRVRYSGSDRS